MPKKRFSAEQIVTVLRQIEVLMSQPRASSWRAPARPLWGHKATSPAAGLRSVLHPTTDIDHHRFDDRFVPTSDICAAQENAIRSPHPRARQKRLRRSRAFWRS